MFLCLVCVNIHVRVLAIVLLFNTFILYSIARGPCRPSKFPVITQLGVVTRTINIFLMELKYSRTYCNTRQNYIKWSKKLYKEIVSIDVSTVVVDLV